jgi:hypothetical protein
MPDDPGGNASQTPPSLEDLLAAEQPFKDGVTTVMSRRSDGVPVILVDPSATHIILRVGKKRIFRFDIVP